ncbi:hypothetical protein, partial [Escherichia coli]|uniref:hypothetical protein n=1 Tax=Escherichia coli TaxID=562 RepID=UPI001A7E17B9
RGSFQGETPGIFIVLSGFATSDLSVGFVMLVRGAEPMEKRQRRGLLSWLCLVAHMFFPVLSPDSVDNCVTVFV